MEVGKMIKLWDMFKFKLYQLKIDDYLHRMLYVYCTITTRKKIILGTHKK